MKVSFIITSFNQRKRVYYSLLSAVNQKLSNGNDYEVILADDNSTDGTLDMVTELFPTVKISLNDKSITGKFTTCTNKNAAVKIATGDRLILSNGDIIFSSSFVDSYCDPIWGDNMVFGPCDRSSENIVPYLEDLPIKIKNSNIKIKKVISHKDIVKILSENKWIDKDPHHDGSVYTYNQEFSPIHPWGGNMSVMKHHFEAVGGFPELTYYGTEEGRLCTSIYNQNPGIKVLSNGKSYSIHLWHPQHNNEGIKHRIEYEL